MPNWCYNDITISGDKDELLKLKKFVSSKTESFDFNKIIPYPKKFKDMDRKAIRMRKHIEKLSEQKAFEYKNKHLPAGETHIKDGYNSGGYEWCINNWGTKWNAGEVYMKFDKDTLRYTFDTAWAQPTPIIIKLGELFPKLRIEHFYSEPGCAFEGKMIIDKGEIKSNDSWDYVEEDEDDEE